MTAIEIRRVESLLDDTQAVAYSDTSFGPVVEFTADATDEQIGRMVRGVLWGQDAVNTVHRRAAFGADDHIWQCQHAQRDGVWVETGREVCRCGESRPAEVLCGVLPS